MSADYFEDAWRRWLEVEVDPAHPDAAIYNPDDPGGLTKYGIAQRYHPDVHVASMTKDEAKRLLRDEYWVRYGLDRIAYRGLAVKTLIVGGLIGMARAVRMLQRACNLLTMGSAKLAEDGRIGPTTAALINSSRHPEAIEELFETQATSYLLSIGKSKYIAGWLKRVDA